MPPLVSAVIPTRNRPMLVRRAVHSALAQTLTEIEVVVVVDGPDPNTCAMLAEIQDPRLRVIELPASRGGAQARNAGALEAQSEWIAFLDDDDEWLPRKLELQLEAAQRSRFVSPIVACRLIARAPSQELIWPRRLPAPSEPLSNYLLSRSSLVQGEGLIQTSMIFAKRELLQKCPFEKWRFFDEWDWLLRADALEGVGIEFVDEPLSIWYIEEKRVSLSTLNSSQYALNWIEAHRHLVTPQAFAGFLMTIVSAMAAREGDWKAFRSLLWQAMRYGRPQGIHYLLFLGMWLVPQDTRRRIRAFLPKEVRA